MFDLLPKRVNKKGTNAESAKREKTLNLQRGKRFNMSELDLIFIAIFAILFVKWFADKTKNF